ncbi:unnamed protein product [Danaus chrysippus]|uniref:Microsomal glutathione S-transferase 1 n=1 Tax=Danaus chrysippus TaxID=151541 RepID=A0A8J2QH67_9NEOP|nr:unnamed protein product [Danaus chrysippus]
MSSDILNSGLMQSYFLYSALLALKLLAFIPLSSLVCRPDKMQRANISDLKNLTPFWLVAALYVTTSPDEETALMLFRTYVLSRLVTALGYIVKLPKVLVEGAFFLSFSITAFMGGWVVYTYRSAI